MCCTRLAGNTGRKKIAILPPLHNFVGLYLRSSKLRHLCRQSEKNLLNNNASSTCPDNYLFITPNGSRHKIYKSIYKKHTIHSIKRNYKLGLQFIHCYEKIAVSTKCRHRLLLSSATPEHKLWMEYFDRQYLAILMCTHSRKRPYYTIITCTDFLYKQ